MSTAAERVVASHRRAQIKVRAGFLRRFLLAWSALSWADIDGTFAGWTREVMAALRESRQESADVALAHHTKLRLVRVPTELTPPPEPLFVGPQGVALPGDPAAGLTAAERDKLAALRATAQERAVQRQSARRAPDGRDRTTFTPNRRPAIDWSRPVKPVIDWGKADDAAQTALLITGPNELKRRAKLLQDERQARAGALALSAQTAARHVLNGGRMTGLELVRADPAALGWARVTGQTRTGPCSFCVMLASRGADYRTEATAGFLVHDNCACTAEPIFNRDEWTGRDQQREWRALWDEVTAGHSGAEARKAFRRHWERLQREQLASASAAA